MGGWRGVAIAGAELLGLSTIAIAQPLFDALQRSTYAFAAADARGLDVVLLALMLALLPPLAMLALELLAGLLSRALRGWVHLTWIALLVSLICWQAVKQAGAASHILYFAIPLAGFAGAAALYLRFEAARLLLRFLAFAAPIAVGLFLFTAPIKSFTLPGGSQVPGQRTGARTPVVLVVFDELPLAALLNEHREIDARRFPNFARLASGSNWYRNALTVADATEEAVPAILTGDFPQADKLATYSDHQQNLFTLLGPTYENNISESATSLCPPWLCAQRGSLYDRLSYLIEVGADTADSFPFDIATRIARDLETGTPGAIVPGGPTEQVDAFLRNMETSPVRSLNVLHVQLPHIPYEYLPSGRRYTDVALSARDPRGAVAGPAGYAIQGLQRLQLQLAYVDRVLGRILTRLHRTGLYERALVAVIADHGAAFIPGSGRRKVNQRERRLDPSRSALRQASRPTAWPDIPRPVQTIDLLPTIADVLGIRMPWRVDGRSLLSHASNGGDNRYMTYGSDSIVHVSRTAEKRSFLAALAVRNGFFGRGNLFTMGASRRDLRAQLRGARRLHIAVDSEGGTTYEPRSGLYPSLVFGRISTRPRSPPTG